MVFQLVMPEDADAEKGMISTTSPIGRAFINKEPGDTVKVDDARRHARSSRSRSCSPFTTKSPDDGSGRRRRRLPARPNPTPLNSAPRSF